jgi:ribosomal protein L11 methyltransferase
LWEDEDSIKAYFDISLIDEEILQNALDSLDFLTPISYSISMLKEENWNAKWEEAFDPVEIGNLCYIYAEFHEKKTDFEYYIKIAPKMAFGTGHHETTYMMIENMSALDFKGKNTLDLGCGSGILSVFAAHKEAKNIDAIDIEKPSVENAEEHKVLNNVDYNVLWGGVEDVPNSKYDIILANINRKVLLEYKDVIKDLVNENGILLMSGILEKDSDLIENAYGQNFTISQRNQRGKWLCYEMKKTTS